MTDEREAVGTVEHTPGPWRARLDGQGSYVEDEARLEGIAGIVPFVHGRTDAEAEANAHLIAAAPALLEALVRLADRFAYDGVPEDGVEEYEEAVAAIRAARGEE